MRARHKKKTPEPESEAFRLIVRYLLAYYEDKGLAKQTATEGEDFCPRKTTAAPG